MKHHRVEPLPSDYWVINRINKLVVLLYRVLYDENHYGAIVTSTSALCSMYGNVERYRKGYPSF